MSPRKTLMPASLQCATSCPPSRRSRRSTSTPSTGVVVSRPASCRPRISARSCARRPMMRCVPCRSASRSSQRLPPERRSCPPKAHPLRMGLFTFGGAIVRSSTFAEGSMDRFWLKSYPPGVPADIDPSIYPSLVALLEESFAKYGDRKAYVCTDKALTFGDVDTLSRALAAWLQSRGLRKGSRVAIMMPNVLQYPLAVAAVLRAGLIAVNVNPLYTARELQHQLQDSGTEAVIVLENFATTLQQALGGTAVKHIVVA